MDRDRFPLGAWSVLIYNLGVILWGVYVRASVSGDGCGDHWPSCGGTLIPHALSAKRIVELTHRVSVVGAILLVIVLVVWAFRVFPKRHPARLGAALALLFTFTEAIVGAMLVLFKLVAHNASLYRAFAISGHLVNTFLLLLALTLTIWWGSGGGRIYWRRAGRVGLALLAGVAGVLILAVSGAITALGDTLYPAASLALGLRQDLTPSANLMIHLRILHPFIAVVVGLYLVAMSRAVYRLRPSGETLRYSRWLALLFCAELAVGLLNLFMLAPIWMQIAHLLVADLLWIVLIFFCAAALPQPSNRARVRFETAYTPEQI